MNPPPTSSEPVSNYQPHWVTRAAFPVITMVFFATEAALGFAVHQKWFWLAIPLALLASHLMHGLLIGFHEASHGMLRKSKLLNEIDGIIIGIMSFTSFSLYRVAHQSHHAYLATERDEELWPFVVPTVPRWARILAAVLELTFGLIFTPLLFVRTFLRKSSPIRSRKVRRRIWMEFALIAASWITILGLVAWFDVWTYFAWMYLLPAIVAANLQSWRKYIEHVGMTGSTVKSTTRSIVAETWGGRLIAFSLLHEPYHGVHHQHAGVPHAELPRLAAELAPTEPDEHAPYPSYHHALRDLIEKLADPRVGPQWRTPGAA